MSCSERFFLLFPPFGCQFVSDSVFTTKRICPTVSIDFRRTMCAALFFLTGDRAHLINMSDKLLLRLSSSSLPRKLALPDPPLHSFIIYPKMCCLSKALFFFFTNHLEILSAGSRRRALERTYYTSPTSEREKYRPVVDSDSFLAARAPCRVAAGRGSGASARLTGYHYEWARNGFELRAPSIRLSLSGTSPPWIKCLGLDGLRSG